MHKLLGIAVLLSVTVSAQTPVKRIAPTPARTSRVSFIKVEFQKLYFGREGPNYTAIKGEPSRGASQPVEISLSGQESIAAIKFELIDEAGSALQTLRLSKMDNSLDSGDYMGVVDVPLQPFRLVASGRDTAGNAFRRVLSRLFRPTDQPPPALQLPTGMPPLDQQRMAEISVAADREMRARLEEQAAASPGGTIVIPRPQISELTSEPLVSRNGSEIGIRLRYQVQFSADGLFVVTPHVFPLFANPNWRGRVTMKVHEGSVEPKPGTVGAGSVQDILLYHGPGQYKAGVAYRFMLDLIPDYVIYNAEKTRTCIYAEKFKVVGAPPALDTWDAIRTSDLPLKYRVDFSQADFYGEIQQGQPQRIFFEGFLREGAFDCGPQPTIHF
jgi:hypothetical protein